MKKNNNIFRVALSLFVAVLVLHTGSHVFAHSSSQAGILAKTSIEGYTGTYVGGEDVGWSIDEDYHTNGTTITYSFSSTDPYLTSTLKSYVTNGASKWSGTVNIVNKTDGTGTGKIKTYYDPEDGAVAAFRNYIADSNGHLTYWEIQINRAYTQSAVVLAHEFGHVIGLNDLYEEKNSGKLMYGVTSGTATAPTALDKWGAKVITGVHTTHTWGYKYHSTVSGVNKHIRYCTECNGLTLIVRQCTYNANNVCTGCGTPRGAQPFSNGNGEATEHCAPELLLWAKVREAS